MAAALTLLSVAACAQSFAAHEVDLMRQPPPLLPVDADAFWNDRQSGVYGQFTVGPGLYAYRGARCRSARVTSINGVTHEQRDETLLYCAGPDGRFFLNRDLSCRAAAGSPRLSCRDPQGQYETLDPA